MKLQGNPGLLLSDNVVGGVPLTSVCPASAVGATAARATLGLLGLPSVFTLLAVTDWNKRCAGAEGVSKVPDTDRNKHCARAEGGSKALDPYQSDRCARQQRVVPKDPDTDQRNQGLPSVTTLLAVTDWNKHCARAGGGSRAPC